MGFTGRGDEVKVRSFDQEARSPWAACLARDPGEQERRVWDNCPLPLTVYRRGRYRSEGSCRRSRGMIPECPQELIDGGRRSRATTPNGGRLG